MLCFVMLQALSHYKKHSTLHSGVGCCCCFFCCFFFLSVASV